MTGKDKPHRVSITDAVTGRWVADSSIARTRPRGDSHSSVALFCCPRSSRVRSREQEQAGSTQGGLSCSGAAAASALPDSGKPTSAVDVTWTHPDYCSIGDNRLQKRDRIKALTMQLHSSHFFMHCRACHGWISHTQLQQFVTGITTTKDFLKEKNSLRPKAEGKHGLNILILCAERVQMMPLTVKKAHTQLWSHLRSQNWDMFQDMTVGLLNLWHKEEHAAGPGVSDGTGGNTFHEAVTHSKSEK